METPNMTDSHTSTRNSTDNLMKSEGSYEISIPFEDVNGEQANDFNGNEPTFGELVSFGQPPSCDSYLLIANLRMQLQISLEKNSWLQKHIEDLKEERNFLRCQLERSIPSSKCQDMNDNQEGLMDMNSMKMCLSPSSPPPPMTTRSSSKHTSRKRPAVPKEEPLAVSQPTRSKGSCSANGGERSWNGGRNGKQFPHKKTNVHYEDMVEEYMEEDGYLEEAVDDDLDETSCEEESKRSKRRRKGGIQTNGDATRVMRTLLFRVKRCMERQRVKDPAGVLIRYNKILVTYQKLKSMAKAFQVHGVDRNTVASTTPIAELLLVAPEKVPLVGEFEPSKEKLLDYARRCYLALDEPARAKVQELKKNNLLLPITYRFRK